MKPGTALKAGNLIMGFLVLVLFLSGLLNEELPKHVFKMIHIPAGILLVIGTVFHLVMHRAWIKTAYFKKKNAA